jgi:hypothetical protein
MSSEISVITYFFLGISSLYYLSFYLIFKSQGTYKTEENQFIKVTVEDICLTQPRMGNYLKSMIGALHDLGFQSHGIVTRQKSNSGTMIYVGVFSNGNTGDIATVNTIQSLGDASHLAPKCFTDFTRHLPDGTCYKTTNTFSAVPISKDSNEHHYKFPSINDLFVLYNFHKIILKENKVIQRGSGFITNDITKTIPDINIRECEYDVRKGYRTKKSEGEFPLTIKGILRMMFYVTLPLSLYYNRKSIFEERKMMLKLQKNEQSVDGRVLTQSALRSPFTPKAHNEKEKKDIQRKFCQILGVFAFLFSAMPKDIRLQFLFPVIAPVFLYLCATNFWPWTLPWAATIFLGIPLYMLIISLGLKKNIVFLKDNSVPKQEPFRDILTRSILVSGHFYGSNGQQKYISSYVLNKNCDMFPPANRVKLPDESVTTSTNAMPNTEKSSYTSHYVGGLKSEKTWMISPNEAIATTVWQQGPDHWSIPLSNISAEQLCRGWYYCRGRELFALQIRLKNLYTQKPTMTYLIFESAPARDAVYLAMQQANFVNDQQDDSSIILAQVA